MAPDYWSKKKRIEIWKEDKIEILWKNFKNFAENHERSHVKRKEYESFNYKKRSRNNSDDKK